MRGIYSWNSKKYKPQIFDLYFQFIQNNAKVGREKKGNCGRGAVISFEKQFVFSLIKWHCDFSELDERMWYGIQGHKRYDRIETRFIALFYVKNEVSAETIFIFIFYCATVSRENLIKLAVLFSDYFGIKNKTGWWFHDFKGHKIISFNTETGFFFSPVSLETGSIFFWLFWHQK